MSANVTVHYKAQSDHRIAFLAKLLGVTNDDALGKMVRLWSVMTELQTDTPDVGHINAILLDERGADMLVRSGLAEVLADDSVRVRSRIDDTTGKDRLEWYIEMQQHKARGGKARATSAPRDRRGRMVSAGPSAGDDCQPSHQTAGISPASDLDLPEEDLSLAREEEPPPLPTQPLLPDVPRSPNASLEAELLATDREFREHRALKARFWNQLQELRTTIAAEIGVQVRPLHTQDPGERALSSRIREAQSLERATIDLEHVLAIAAAQARADCSVQWLTGTVFEEKSYRCKLGMTLADVERRAAKAFPRRGPPPEPTRQITDLSKR